MIDVSSASNSESKFQTACIHFDEGNYFEAHELWEDLWNEAAGPRHAYLQCLIQVSVALHHAGRCNWAGSKNLLARSLGYLEKGRSESEEVDLDRLKDLVLDFALQVDQAAQDEKFPIPYFKLPVRPLPSEDR